MGSIPFSLVDQNNTLERLLMSVSHTQTFEDRPDKLTVIKFIKRFVIGLLYEEDIVQMNKNRCEDVFFSRRYLSSFKDIFEQTEENSLPLVLNFSFTLCSVTM